ncbi:hypothetical protein [Brevibacillus aydinogluensis]|jgi:hypothetical protein|uniref:DUF3310 domain-containing protein n=1 Tax=Brevibacillus aydinogluensis TaxID=927786 RepID=A0AA48RIV9_9BACL|nr:hypothetical protein [Brevibacillus aydinogluensis]CAJ1003895.1 DUF3310 domain-containing protein [Brevibacillus aydinogluensis]
MKFTIDFVRRLSSEKRLKVDNCFKTINEERKVYEDDMIFKSYEDAEYWFYDNLTADIDGQEYQTKPKMSRLGSPIFVIRPHRISKPKKHLITKEELREVLINGDNEVYNMLVVDYDGYPKLIQKPSSAYAVRLEGYAAGNNYVGRQSKLYHLDETYRILLEAWLLHLTSGQSIYKDYLSGELQEEELIEKIHEAIEKYV